MSKPPVRRASNRARALAALNRIARMRSQYFGLREDCLNSPTAMDVAVVGAMMLWPTDAEMRQQALGSLAITLILDSGNHPQPQTVAERREFRELIITHATAANHEEQIKAGYKRGFITGLLLYRSIAANLSDPENFSFGALKKEMAGRFDAKDHVSIPTIDKIWHDYRSVAPYWASYVSDGRQAEIPCRPTDLGKFLSLADHFRTRGEAAEPRQSSQGPLLLAGETVRVPPTIQLPETPWPFAE